MTPEFTAIMMMTFFVLGAIMIVQGGVGFMQSNLVLLDTNSKLAQTTIFSVAAFMFVAGISVHFTGSSNTAFLKGQMAQTSRCELESEAANPSARGGSTGVIGRQIVACMQKSGFDWIDQAPLCREAPMATNGYCYQSASWFGRAITNAQLAFN